MNVGLIQLQNGTDIRGVASDSIIDEAVTLTPQSVEAIGRGFAQWVQLQTIENGTFDDNRPIRIAVGTDSRLTSPEFAETLASSITSIGCDVLHCGMATTPAMRQSTEMPEVKADGAIMVTGSHASFNWNGMKFFFDGGDIDKEQMADILRLASEERTPCDDNGNVHVVNVMSFYAKRLRDKIKAEMADISADPGKPLAGLKIIVDAGNGSGGFFTSRVLTPLGADVSGSQFLTPDGRFPNHPPNPEDYEALRSVKMAVGYHQADIGIIFDSDVDRVGIVDEAGRAINRNEFVALASAIALEEHPGTTIVTDSMTSKGICSFIKDVKGGIHCRYQRGYHNVVSEAIRQNEAGSPCWLAVETSGHAAFRENNFCDDGAYFATKVIIRLARLKREGRNLYSLIEQLPVALESCEYRLKITSGDFTRIAEEVLDGLRQYANQVPSWENFNENREGMRVFCNAPKENGMFMLRLSLHSSNMPLSIESDVKGGVDAIIGKLKLSFRNQRSVDSSCLYK